jgi:hypothetical protein
VAPKHAPVGTRSSGLGRDALADALRCARFLRGAASHRARPDDVYVSSYPRSGTTWLCLIVHLVQGGDPSFEHISQIVPWYERDLALGRARACDYARRSSPRTFKSHLPSTLLPRGARHLYALRDVRDVVVSYYHFYCSHLGYTDTFEAFFERFLRGDLQYGSWFRHVAGFRARAARPDLLIVEYEAMRRDPQGALAAVARLCGRRLDAERERSILEHTSFAAMKEHEARFDHQTGERLAQGRTQPDHSSRGSFVRAGRVGGFHGLLTPAHEERLDEARRALGTPRFPELQLAAFLR